MLCLLRYFVYCTWVVVIVVLVVGVFVVVFDRLECLACGRRVVIVFIVGFVNIKPDPRGGRRLKRPTWYRRRCTDK